VKAGRYSREGKWTKSIAVGGKEFLEQTKKQPGLRAQGRKPISCMSDETL